ncbi:conserved hypothetical protein YjcH [Escherichia coli IAI39]|nr:conserved hypothetical protein YjcH [Escherichia coli IAI39]
MQFNNALSGLHAPFFIVGKGKYKNSPKYFALQEGSKRASPQEHRKLCDWGRRVRLTNLRRERRRGTSGESVMNGTIYQRIEDNAHFRELVEKRQWFATILSIIMLAVYIGFILLIAFAPGWLGTPLNPNTSVTRGIPIGVGVIVISFVLTGIYIWRANGEFDRLNNEVLHEVQAS